MHFVLNVLLILLFLDPLAHGRNFPIPTDHEDRDWFAAAQNELQVALEQEQNVNVARNVILFLGDGMGVTNVWASRVYAGQYKHGQSGEEFQLEFEKFPFTGLSKTYNVNRMSPDSAGTATAFLSGVKSQSETIGVNQNVVLSDCSTQEENIVTSILDWSMDAGKWTGIVSTARVTHATIAATYAHSVNRKWESDAEMGSDAGGECKDIARQLVEDNPDIHVILGGGRQRMRGSNYTDEVYGTPGMRLDGRDLIQEWIDEKEERGVSHHYVWNTTSLQGVDSTDTDYLLGLFAPAHMSYDMSRDPEVEPSLVDMTKKAIEILSKADKGFFLLVEGSNIDYGHHANLAKAALDETWMLSNAVQTAKEMTDDDITLIVVTADHSHTFVTNGNPSRGRDILGKADNENLEPALDNLPYTILAYANGPGGPMNMQYREDITYVNTTADNYTQQALVPMELETHGSEDVAIYATGPMAHLLSGVHEQNFIPHAMAYAACIGDNTGHCDETSASNRNIFSVGLHVAVLLACCLTI